MGDHVNLHVECYSGYEYAEYPKAFYWEGSRFEIIHIYSRWRTPEGRCFRVSLQDGRVGELTYSDLEDNWHIDWD